MRPARLSALSAPTERAFALLATDQARDIRAENKKTKRIQRRSNIESTAYYSDTTHLFQKQLVPGGKRNSIALRKIIQSGFHSPLLHFESLTALPAGLKQRPLQTSKADRQRRLLSNGFRWMKTLTIFYEYFHQSRLEPNYKAPLNHPTNTARATPRKTLRLTNTQ